MSSAARGTAWPADVRTLAVDIGGSGFKAAVLDPHGEMIGERVRIDTPYPCPPEKFVPAVVSLTTSLPQHHRVTVGFPGLVRAGKVRYIVSLSRPTYGAEIDPGLTKQWHDFALEEALTTAFGLPTKVANDADVQGCAVVEGVGLEFVMTLGTGVGSALFSDGRLLPHLELGHAPFRKQGTVEDELGNVAREQAGDKKWRKRVSQAIAAYHQYLFFDHIYIGGGNAKHLKADNLPDNATIVANTAGITGGVRIWSMAP
ncbi:MAG: ROK family protein [Candidatus Nanopelagicales bacterium]